eukprot:CAMPEP_0168388104 /NCGR_PEP_ID=MMETSP0228-20121227/16283_1 /TAXON_ID=133427 /ORGANISM="Protoceratium reticulatum, Strain CCCM 535 (=CCMP 1889)" /LENGTH=50 /DNA_ID=CAMNT_0008401349 /DNA_START=757 /DNA_END=906 /DNA_ORIENTATION=+
MAIGSPPASWDLVLGTAPPGQLALASAARARGRVLSGREAAAGVPALARG